MVELQIPIQTVKTTRLELRVFKESHLDDFHAIWTNTTTTIWTLHGVSIDLEDSRARMARLIYNSETPSSLNYGVFIRPPSPPPPPAAALSASDSETTAVPPCSGTDRMIGMLGVPRVSSPGTAEVGYIYDESAWGHGYATEALAAYMNVYWDHAKTIDAVIAMVDPENIPSIKVLKKCGFVVVEYLVKDIVLPALGVRDTLVFRIERPRAARASNLK